MKLFNIKLKHYFSINVSILNISVQSCNNNTIKTLKFQHYIYIITINK